MKTISSLSGIKNERLNVHFTVYLSNHLVGMAAFQSYRLSSFLVKLQQNNSDNDLIKF